jgi:cell wall-associated NlpC family hydrolase
MDSQLSASVSPDAGACGPRRELAVARLRQPSSLGIVAFILAAVIAAFLPTQAHADDHVAAKIADVAQQIDALENDQASAADALQAALHTQAQITDELASLQEQIVQAQESSQQVARQVNSIAATAYMTGQVSTEMSLVFANSPRQFIDGAYDLQSLSSNTNHILKQVRTKKTTLSVLAAQVSATQIQQADVVKQAMALRDQLQTKINQEKTLLASLKSQQRADLAKAIAAKKAAAQKAAAAKAAQVEAARLAAQQTAVTATPGQVVLSPTSTDVAATSWQDRTMVVIAYALSQIGKPYSFDAHPPVSWDCSKLTSAAWAQVGVHLEAYSFTQYGQARHISRDELLPGDLLFFFEYGAHHVGLYLGQGFMVDAANPSVGVTVSRPFEGWYADHFTGAARPY